jgi:predicted nucleotidyltransferase
MGGRPVNSPKGLGPQQAAALQEFASAVRDCLGSRLIALKLFGSQVRGEAAPDSDLDVLVAVDEASPALENAILDLAFQVNLAHDVYISPRVIARRVLEDPVWGSTPFIRTLQAEGAPL